MLRIIEQKIEGLIERTFGRAFKSQLQPVELARKLSREMEQHKTVSVSRVYVPNEFAVYLSSADREEFASYEHSLRAELANYLDAQARGEGLSMVGEAVVLFETDSDLRVGEFGIACRMTDRPGGAAPPAVAPEQAAVSEAPEADPFSAHVADEPAPVVDEIAGTPLAPETVPEGDGDPEEPAPVPEEPAAAPEEPVPVPEEHPGDVDDHAPEPEPASAEEPPFDEGDAAEEWPAVAADAADAQGPVGDQASPVDDPDEAPAAAPEEPADDGAADAPDLPDLPLEPAAGAAAAAAAAPPEPPPANDALEGISGTQIFTAEQARDAGVPTETMTLVLPGGARHTLNRRVTTVGRGRGNDLVIPDANVSRNHAEIRHIGLDYFLVDLDSTNGVEVNGEQVRRHALAHGDVVVIGTTDILVELS